MDLKANLFLSVTNSFDYSSGLSLKSRALRKSLKRIQISLAEFSEHLGLTGGQVRFMLLRHIKFSKEQIRKIVYFFGGEIAVNILWFPTNNERLRVTKEMRRKDVMDENENYHSDNCFEDDDYCGDTNWEQSYECESLMLDSNILPSRRFFRRRSDD